MPSKSKQIPVKRTKATAPNQPEHNAESVIALLRKVAKKSVREGMARFAIPADKAFGVPVGTMRQIAKRIGQDHELAAALWETGWYEGRIIAVFLDEPERVTPSQMDQWCKAFDNWAICDTACLHLFDRTPHAWKKVAQWSSRKEEFEKRAAFALLWALSVHDKTADNERFSQGLLLIEREAHDERNFVKKAVNMALRAIGKRNGELHTAAVAVATRLSEPSQPAAARWVGKDALRELASASVSRRLAAKKHAVGK